MGVQHFIIKTLKYIKKTLTYIAKLKDLYSEHSYIYHLDSTINILVYVTIHLSTRSSTHTGFFFNAFQSKLQYDPPKYFSRNIIS